MRSLLLFLFVLISTLAYPQWGVKGGTGIASLTNISDAEYKVMGNIGVTYDIRLSEKWFIQPEVAFATTGTSFKDGHLDMYALELPIVVSFRPKIKSNMNLIFDCGWFVRYAMFGDSKNGSHKLGVVDGNTFDTYKRFDTGVNIGTGLALKKYYTMISFLCGATSIRKDNPYTYIYNKSFRLAFGYKF